MDQALKDAPVLIRLHRARLRHKWQTLTPALTKVNGAARDANTFNSELLFYIGAAETSGGTDPSFAPTVCALDFMECILETARTDAEIQQAITDLATKWGITLT